MSSSKAVIIAGGGVKNTNGHQEIIKLAKILNIPIVSSKLIKKHQPDIIIILSWNFAKLIIKNTKKKLKKDIIFIVPLPRPYIVK